MSDIHICMYNNHLWGCSSPHVTSWIFGSWPRSWPLENWIRQDSAGNPSSALPSGRIYIRTGAAVGGSTSVSTSSNAAPWQLAMFWQHPLLCQVMKYCFEVFVGDCLWGVATWFKLLGIRALTSIADGFHWWLTSFFPFLQAAKHVGIQEYPRCSAWTPKGILVQLGCWGGSGDRDRLCGRVLHLGGWNWLGEALASARGCSGQLPEFE